MAMCGDPQDLGEWDGARLAREYGARWEIQHPLGVWTATQRTATGEHFLVGYTPGQLAQKLAAAEREEQ